MCVCVRVCVLCRWNENSTRKGYDTHMLYGNFLMMSAQLWGQDRVQDFITLAMASGGLERHRWVTHRPWIAWADCAHAESRWLQPQGLSVQTTRRRSSACRCSSGCRWHSEDTCLCVCVCVCVCFKTQVAGAVRVCVGVASLHRAPPAVGAQLNRVQMGTHTATHRVHQA